MNNIIKGFIIGIGKIIPGVSGSLLAVLLGVYDKAIDYIINIKYYKKESIKYLLPLGVGILLSIIIFSKIINYALNKYYFLVMMFFVGLLLGVIPKIKAKASNKYIHLTIITLIIFFILSISNINNTYQIKGNYKDTLTFLISGFLEAIGTIVPGVSSSALLMINGTYNIIIKSISNISNINILLPFILGLLIGVLITIKLINYLLKKYNQKTYNIIFGTLLSSVLLLIIKSFKYKITIKTLLLGLIFLILGLIISLIFKED